MKIRHRAYPEEMNWRKYVAFASPDDEKICLVFLWRLAAFCRDFRVKATDTIGFRSPEKQEVLYKLYLSGKGNLAAKPGTSWHEAGCAVDMREKAEAGWFKTFSNTWVMPYSTLKQGLAAYGLCAPLNSADKPKASVEWWHWQPIETAGYSGNRMAFLAPDDAINGKPALLRVGSSGPWVAELRHRLKMVTVGNFDAALKSAVVAFQASHGLTPDGICGPATWAKLPY